MHGKRNITTEGGTPLPSGRNFRQKPSSSGFNLSSYLSNSAALSVDESEQGFSSSTRMGPSSSQEVPDSVRTATPELRAAIRRKQNSESAKRSRERKKAEENEMRRKIEENSERISRLEKQVDSLAATLNAKRRIKRSEKEKNISNLEGEGRDSGSSSKHKSFADPF